MEATGLLSVLNYYPGVEAALGGPARTRLPERGDSIEIVERHEGRSVVLSLTGGLDGAGASVLLTRISAVIGPGTTGLVLDCEGLTYINSTGLRAVPHRGQDMPAGGRDIRRRRARAAMPLGHGDERLSFGHRLLGNVRGSARCARLRGKIAGTIYLPGAGRVEETAEPGSRVDRRAIAAFPIRARGDVDSHRQRTGAGAVVHYSHIVWSPRRGASCLRR